MKSEFNEQCITYSQMSLIFNMRIFWRRLMIWTRIYIISRYLGIGTAEVSFERLYIENLDFGDMLRIHFSRSISDNYSQLLNQFSIGLRELITALIQKDLDAARQNIDRLLLNADQTAAFLASINPYFDEAEWKSLLRTYLQDTIQAANLFASEDYRMDIEYFDRLTALSNTMGDTFAQGLYDYITAGALNTDNPPPQDSQRCVTEEQMNQIYNIRMFWFDLIYWVRAFMLSRYRDVGDADEVYARLQQVVSDYVNNLNEFFGETPGANELQVELNAYIDLIDSLITAQKAGNTEDIDRITRLLYQNASDRAASVSSINPYWDENDWRTRLNNNLRSTLDESAMFLTGDYARNLDIFSSLMNQAESSSDYFAQGLLNYLFQSPQQ
ncbi:MAG TPA: hypothetical protein VEA58_10515 [Anaerovoracaceae bacterium]|nr:hypothetical protein [Anaerovoracaceae bacterium]